MLILCVAWTVQLTGSLLVVEMMVLWNASTQDKKLLRDVLMLWAQQEMVIRSPADSDCCCWDWMFML